MKTTSRSRTAAAIGGGLALAALIPALPALGQSAPPPTTIVGSESPPRPIVEIQDTGVVFARGAAALVNVDITCFSGQVFPSVQLTQASGRRIASGGNFNGFEDGRIICDGTTQTFTATVTPFNAPFRRGEAFAEVSVFGNASGGDAEVITLERARGRGRSFQPPIPPPYEFSVPSVTETEVP